MATTSGTISRFTVSTDGGLVLGTAALTAPPASGTLVSTSGTQTLSSKTLTAPVISTIINTGTLTLPTSTDTLVGRATTDTLTNKTLTAPVFSTIVNTGTLTLPTSTDTLVGRATTDTLTNKTLTSPVFSTIVNTGTLTLPTSTDTLVARATTDTLTNKTITDATNTVRAVQIGPSASTVTIGGAAPAAGYTLQATSATTAVWAADSANYTSEAATTDNTPTNIELLAVSTDDTSYAWDITVAARSDGEDAGAFWIKALYNRSTGAGSLNIVGTDAITSSLTAGASTWTVTTYDAAGAMGVTVTGVNATDIQWNVTAFLTSATSA